MKLEEKVAQLFMVGSQAPDPLPELEPFFRTGLGGFLLFRHHVQPYPCAESLKEALTRLDQQFGGPGLTFVGIDQEGGQVERLPHWLFPTGVNPVVYGLKQDMAFCEAVNSEVARRLRWLGINLNFTPTVDLNRERQNPIIAQRAYGQSPAQVVPFAQAVIRAHQQAGVLPVAKHFPGHGSGSVDSHLDLPVFEAWEEDELVPYQALIASGLPGVLVAHGLYPRLYKTLSSPMVPSTLSNPVVTGLLRNTLGFEGVVFSDDMTMGAIAESMDPVEAGLMALNAGCDMLVYRTAQPEALAVYQALLKRVQSGRYPESEIDVKVARIQAAKAQLAQVPPPALSPEAVSQESCHRLSFAWAQHALIEHIHQFVSPLPLHEGTRWGVVYPDPQAMVHYGPDLAQGPTLGQWLQRYGLSPAFECAYAPFSPDLEATELPPQAHEVDVLVFMAVNSHLYPGKQALYRKLRAACPRAKIILASLAMPWDGEVLPEPWVHIQLPSYRPQAVHAFVQWLVTPPGQFA